MSEVRLQMPEGELALRLRKKLEDYLQRWQKVLATEDNRFKRETEVKRDSGDWYAWFILNTVVNESTIDSTTLYARMMEETADGMDETVFWNYIHIIANYSTLGHSGEEFGNKPLPTIE